MKPFVTTRSYEVRVLTSPDKPDKSSWQYHEIHHGDWASGDLEYFMSMEEARTALVEYYDGEPIPNDVVIAQVEVAYFAVNPEGECDAKD